MNVYIYNAQSSSWTLAQIGIFIIGWLTDRKDPSNPDSPAWLYMILVSVTLAVAAIPEGIPLCVTISLHLGSELGPPHVCLLVLWVGCIYIYVII